MVAKERLSSAMIFQGLSQEELGEIAKLCEEVTFDDTEKIVTEGKTTDQYYILEEGSVDLRFELPFRDTSKEMTVTTIKPGECFTWSALVPPHKATLSCYSVGKSKAIKISGHELLDLCKKNPPMGFKIMQKLASMIAHRLTGQQEVFIKDIADSLEFKW